MKKRIISLLLALIMAVSLLPVSVLAETDASLDLSKFTFTLSNKEVTNADFQYNNVTAQKKSDGSYSLIAPTYAVAPVAVTDNSSMTIKAPDGFDKTFSVTFSMWEEVGAAKTEKTVTSVNGVVTVDKYYNRSPGRLTDDLYGPCKLEYSDFVFKVEGSEETCSASFELFSDLRNIQVYCKTDATMVMPSVVKSGENAYSVTLQRGNTYSFGVAGGLDTNMYTRSSYYINDGSGEKLYTEYTYTPGTESGKDLTIRISNAQEEYHIADKTYKLHITVQDAAVKPEFDKYVVTVNGEEAALKKVGTSYVLPSLTQFDTLEIEAIVKNTDETAVFEWTRGAGLAKTQIEGTTAKVTVDTSSTSFAQYMINATVTCGGVSVKLPTIRVQKINALKVATPKILQQPVGAEYTVGQTAEPLTVVVENPGLDGTLTFNWYRCDDESKANPTLVYKESKHLVASGGGQMTQFTPPVQEAGTNWYYCELYKSVKTLDSDKITSDCAKVEVKAAEMPLKGDGTEDSPWLLTSEADLNVVREKVAEGSSFVGKYFAFANDIELSADWTPIGATKDGKTDTKKGTNILPFSGVLDGRNFTVKIAEGGKPLFNIVRDASIKNLKIYGTKIEGFGLIDRYDVDYGDDGDYSSGCPTTVTIDNCHILAGTNIKNSGFLGGYASGANTVTISNCTAASGVTIGYGMGSQYDFVNATMTTGSFAGDFNGTITNCSSAATVMGKRCAGGIVGRKGQSMGDFIVRDCTFTGTVVSEGNAGGIVGSGYNDSSAPNSPCVVVENCVSTGDITGKNCVGGIIGREGSITQCWDNGVGGIRNNEFTGKIHASGDKVGGIAGYISSLNRYNIIENNYYAADCGAKQGIGTVDYVDTSCTTHETSSGATYFDTSKALPQIKGVVLKDHNRTDDPLGADKEKLCSTKKRTDVYVTDFALTGEYKTEYRVGDTFDTTGMVFTATWSNGEMTTVKADDVTFEGFSSEKPGQQTIIAKYGDGSVNFSVLVKPQGGKKIAVVFSFLGDTVHGENGQSHTLADGNLLRWIDAAKITVDSDATVLDVITAALGDKYTILNESGNYIQSITLKDGKELGEFTNGNLSGWMYTLNGVHPNLGVAQQYLNDGDVIVFHYTDDYTREGSMGGDESKSAQEVVAMIAAIGEVDLTKGTAIGATRTAYDALTDAEKKQVTNYDVLLAAEAAYAKLVAEMGEKLDEIYKTTGDFIQGLGTPTVNSTGGEWMVIGLARSGRPVPAGYYDNVVEYVKAKADANERLHRAKVTDNARVILALTAIGKDVTNVGGHNLLKGLDNMAYVQKQGINGPIFTLIALDSHNYPTMGDVTREKLIQVILDAQLPGGGWNLSGENADTDMTAMAIQALAPYYKTNETVKAAVDKALEALSALQRNDGGFGSWGTVNSESCAQVIVALTALGIDPATDSRFVKNGNTVLDALAGFYVTGGGFKHTADGERNGMATEQGYYALAAYFRFVNGQTSLYDMSDVTIQIDSHTHAFGAWTVTTPATCTKDGVETRSCACGETETRIIPATGHAFGAWTVTTPATCTTDGVETRSCACGETETRIIPATGHAFGAWTVTTPATCTTDGVETRSCACGETETQIIPATGHVDADHDGKCDVCQAVITPVDPGKTDPTNPGTDTPATGDTGVLVWVIALPVAAVAAAFVLKRKKREE